MEAASFTFDGNNDGESESALKDNLQDELGGSFVFDGIKNEEVLSRRDELMETFRSRQKSINSSFDMGSARDGAIGDTMNHEPPESSRVFKNNLVGGDESKATEKQVAPPPRKNIFEKAKKEDKQKNEAPVHFRSVSQPNEYAGSVVR